MNHLLFTRTQPKTNLQKITTTNVDTNKQVKVTLEVYQSPEMNEKLNNPINIPKDTILPKTFIVQNIVKIAAEEVPDVIKANWLFPHNPIYTVSFLKKFKIGDGRALKN